MLAYRYIQFMPEGAMEPGNQMKTLAMIRISDDIVSLIRCWLGVFLYTIQFRYFQSSKMSHYMYIKGKRVAEWEKRHNT